MVRINIINFMKFSISLELWGIFWIFLLVMKYNPLGLIIVVNLHVLNKFNNWNRGRGLILFQRKPESIICVFLWHPLIGFDFKTSSDQFFKVHIYSSAISVIIWRYIFPLKKIRYEFLRWFHLILNSSWDIKICFLVQ